MKKSKKAAKKTIATSLKNMTLQVKRKAAKYNQPIAVSKDGVLFLADVKRKKGKTSV